MRALGSLKKRRKVTGLSFRFGLMGLSLIRPLVLKEER